MMKAVLHPFAHRYLLTLVTASLVFSCSRVHAQASLSPGISSGLGGSLSQSSQTTGFNGVFEPSSGNLATEDMHTDVNDATHSQLLGSALSPIDIFTVNTAPQTAPRTEVLTDAQRAVGITDSYFGGRANHTFTPGGVSGYEGALAGRRSSLANLGTQSMQSAFSGGINARAAFSGAMTVNTAAAPAFSGGGIVQPRTTTGVGVTQNLISANGLDATSAYNATDPVLSGSTSGYTADLQLEGDMPLPSSVTDKAYEDYAPPEPHYQYDDGQTPQTTFQNRAGAIIGAAPEYSIPIGGFPDSTKGLAGQMPEAALAASPFQPLRNSEISPFAPVSDGTVYGIQTGVHPDLHRTVPSTPFGSFAHYEQRAQRARRRAGLSISQSLTLQEQDRKDFQHRAEHRRHSNVNLENGDTSQSLVSQRPIR